MKKIQGLIMALMLLVPIFLVGAIVVGLLSTLFTDPQTFLKIALYVVVVVGVVFGIGYLFTKSKILQNIANVLIPVGFAIFGLWFFGAIAFGWLHAIFTEPKAFFTSIFGIILLVVVGGGAIALIGFLFTNEKTAMPSKVILGISAVIILVNYLT